MRSLLLTLIVVCAGFLAKAQKIDSIYFNLYTDSLKRHVHNYINLDGKLSNGTWVPLTAKELNFTSSGGKFEGNNLILDSSFTDKKVTIKAVLKNNPSVWKEVTIYVKTLPDNEKLKTVDEVLTPSGKTRRRG